MKNIAKVHAEGIHVKHGSIVAVAPLPQPLPEGATNVEWDAENLYLDYDILAEEEGAEPVHESRQLTQADLDAALAWTPTIPFEVLKKQKEKQFKKARDEEWMEDLITSFGVPFKTDVQTQIDIQMMIQMLEPEEVFEGYKCADGVRRNLTREQFQLALQEGVGRKVAASTVDEVKMINWS